MGGAVTDDMHYWVPAGPADYDPATRLCYINDNRSRLATRIRQLNRASARADTGVTDAPAGPNVELLSERGK